MQNGRIKKLGNTKGEPLISPAKAGKFSKRLLKIDQIAKGRDLR